MESARKAGGATPRTAIHECLSSANEPLLLIGKAVILVGDLNIRYQYHDTFFLSRAVTVEKLLCAWPIMQATRQTGSNCLKGPGPGDCSMHRAEIMSAAEAKLLLQQVQHS